MKSTLKSLKMATTAVHGENKKHHHNAINTPIYYSSTFEFDNFENLEQVFNREKEGFIYTRWSNPTRQELEIKMALLEQGEAALAFGSGMGAISATLLTNLKHGDHIIFDNVIYGCTFSLITKFLVKYGITYSAIDLTNLKSIN
ncbi:PLP-dependent transferase [Spiroplasma sp. AdecLV25b]|uniref:PLP-dependent transferase n=1 Tax=Spiroplasma sp. AdecLV25b TaxID=3027162 RepID=UPI0027E17F92|nr:PLP-dependent transferase [Spiroplasma sp. AdecLV25b]